MGSCPDTDIDPRYVPFGEHNQLPDPTQESPNI